MPLQITRRTLLALPLASAAQAAPLRTESGWTQDWFGESFLDLREDLVEAGAAGQRLCVMFDQRGCPYCEQMHKDHLADAAVEGFIRPRFRFVQLDLHGARPVTDTDGQVLEERALARRWRVTFTPTIIFLPEALPATPGSGQRIEVARMHGLLAKPQFLGLFRFVATRGYADGTAFPAWWSRQRAG